jgi:hypothetical protein
MPYPRVKLVLKNLGGISNAEIDIRPLTAFVGENGTNKSWASYCLWDLMRRTMGINPSSMDTEEKTLTIEPKYVADTISAEVARVVDECIARIHVPTEPMRIARQDLIRDVRGHSQEIIFSLPSEAIQSLLHVNSSEANRATASLVVSADDFCADDSVVDICLDRSLMLGEATYSGPGVGVKLKFNWRGPNSDLKVALTKLITQFARGFMGRSFLLTLPSERKALVQAYRILLDLGRKASLPGAVGVPPDDIMAAPALEPYMSKPSIHFLHLLDRLALSYNVPGNAGFKDALNHLEQDILGGAVKYVPKHDASSDEPGQTHQHEGGLLLPGHRGFAEAAAKHGYHHADETVLVFQRRDGNNLKLEASASIVRSFAALNLYLRHMVQPTDIIIVDEPEMNGHPAEQVRIIELFAYLVSKGLRVVLTTHSPYMLDHLGTLVQASRLDADARARIVKKLDLRLEGAMLNPDQVAIYRFGRDGIVTPIFNSDTCAINPAIFSDVGTKEANLFGDVLAEKYHVD